VSIVLILLLALTALNAAAAPNTQMDEAEWLIMLYSVADDDVLEEDMLIDIQEMEFIGSTDQVHIVVQVDRYDGAFDGMGDFTSVKRYYITQDDDLEEFNSEEIEDLGELNMADGETLFDFTVWAIENFPARKRMLILSDHGSGWPGGFGDPDPGVRGVDDIFLVDVFGLDNLWLMEIDRTLEAALAETGIDQLDIIGFDACLMAHVEVFTAVAPHARYAVASEEVEPGLGWAYIGFLEALTLEPEMDAATLANTIVDTYIFQDVRLYDPDYAGGLDPQVAATEIFHDVTLSAVDLSLISDVNTALDEFAATLSTVDQRIVATARSYARSYESVFGDEWPSPYIDLGNFAELAAQNSNDPAVQSAAEALLAAIQQAVIAETHGPARKGSTGIAIYFPVPDMHAVGDNFGYTTVAGRFTDATQWDEFLAFHAGGGAAVSFTRPQPDAEDLLGEEFADLTEEDLAYLLEEIALLLEEEYTPDEIIQLLTEADWPEEIVIFLVENGLLEATEAAPALPVLVSKPIRVAPITLSAEVTFPGEPVTIETVVSGSNVGFIYTFIGRLLPDEDALIIEDMDYIFSEEDREAGGVVYPVWPEEAFDVAYDWEPTVYAVSNGAESVRVLFAPESYGESPTYSVEAIYHFADGSADRRATLFFRDGVLVRAITFTGPATSSAGAPWEVRPKAGDSVTLLQRGYNLSDESEEELYSREAGTLTFGDEPLFIEETPAPSGNYVVGVIAEDLDGNSYEAYEIVFVVNEDAEAEEGLLPYVNDDLQIALLYPEDWEVYEDDGLVLLANADETALIAIEDVSDADADPAESNADAITAVVDGLGDNFGLEEIETSGDLVESWLGAFDAEHVDFSAEVDGNAYTGAVLATTPIAGVTYAVVTLAADEIYEESVEIFDVVLYSFDILISGIERLADSPPPPAMGEILFADDFSDAESGLWYAEEADNWGIGYYDLENEVYIYELVATSGAIYDYYEGQELDDAFLLQATVGHLGAWNNAYGLIFQVVDDESFYAFRISGDGYFLVEKSGADGVETLIDWTIADMITSEEGDPNLLTVVGEGDLYSLYINEQWVGNFTDDSYSSGTIGIIADNFDGETSTVIYFDDLTVGEIE
jgi:hypothetical protein